MFVRTRDASVYIALLSTLLPQVNAGLTKRDLISPTVAGWDSLGCWDDNVTSRTLQGGGTTGDDLTVENCLSYCVSNGFSYAGVEWSRECYCGDKPFAGRSVQNSADCNMPCTGDNTEACGGSNRINIYKSQTLTSPQVAQGVAGFEYVGCYTDSTGKRTLSYRANVDGGDAAMTPEKCMTACSVGNYLYAGVEYAGECYCGNDLGDGQAAPDGDALCNMKCTGDSTAFCGGPGRLSLYNNPNAIGNPTVAPAPSGWTYEGCYADSVADRTLRNRVDVPGGSSAMTVELCLAACSTAGYSIGGIEFGQECYCDTQQKVTTTSAPESCDMPCTGAAAEVCGGPDRITIYAVTPTIPTQPEPVNLLVNGGFDLSTTSPAPWIPVVSKDGTGVTINYGLSTSDTLNGSQNNYFVNANMGSGGFARFSLTENVTFTPGTVAYEFGFPIKVLPGATLSGSCVLTTYLSSSTAYITTLNLTTVGYRTYGFPWLTYETQSSLKVEFFCTGGSGNVSLLFDGWYAKAIPKSASLLANGDAETSTLSPWVLEQGDWAGSLVVNTTFAGSGSNSFQLTNSMPSASPNAYKSVYMLQPISSIVPGQVYRGLYAQAVPFGIDPENLYCTSYSVMKGVSGTYYNAGGQSIGHYWPPLRTWMWVGAYKFTAPEPMVSAGIMFMCSGPSSPAVIAVDDIYLLPWTNA